MSDTVREYSKMTNDELVVLVQKGERAKRAMAPGAFLHDDLVPAMEEELTKIEAGLLWRPGMTDNTVEKIGTDRIWRSGISFGMGKMWDVLNRMKNEGKEAAKVLETRMPTSNEKKA